MEIQEIQDRLEKLKSEAKPQFGIMTAQHMVEHLILTLKLSYGRVKIQEFIPNEKQLAAKNALLYTDLEFPEGIKAPGLPASLIDLRFPDLGTAKNEFSNTFKSYKEHFETNPDSKTFHPRFGPLNFSEWETFHKKHIGHHFRQFNI